MSSVSFSGLAKNDSQLLVWGEGTLRQYKWGTEVCAILAKGLSPEFLLVNQDHFCKRLGKSL